jgi:hypothetical protein
MRRLQFFVAGIATLSLVGAGLARAEEPKAPAAPAAEVDESTQRVVELEKQYKQHLSDLADDALKKDCKTALELANQLSDEKLKARALLVIGKILDGTNHDDVRLVAIKTIGDSGAKELFRYVKQYLAQPNPKVVPPLIMDAIDCAAKLKPGEAVVPMLSLEENSDVYTVNVAAMKALSNYGDNKQYRAKIVKDLVDDIRKDRPGISYRWQGSQGVGSGGARVKTRPRGIRTGEDTRNRYEALAGEMCTACNKLTGQNVAAPEDWFDLIEKYKTDLEALWGK